MSDYKQTRDAAGKVTTQYDKMLRNLDDDLVKQLRNSKGWPTLGNAAADRTEELEEHLCLTEEKLAKAVAIALEECPFQWGFRSYNDWWHDRRTTLAAITETPHD